MLTKLKTLWPVFGATQLLARSLNDESYAEFTDIIINEVDRLTNLADTMLGSRQLPSYENVNVHEPLERVRSLIANQTKKKSKLRVIMICLYPM